MKTIWKWPLQPVTTILMPQGAKVLTVQEQNGVPQLWAMVESDMLTYPRKFCIYGTGHKLPADSGQYIGTFQMQDGGLVLHVFEMWVSMEDYKRELAQRDGDKT